MLSIEVEPLHTPPVKTDEEMLLSRVQMEQGV